MLLVLNRWNEKGKWVQDFLLSPEGCESFHSDLPRGGVITCVWSVCRWLSQWWLVFFIGVRCYSERWVWDLLPHGRLSPFVVEQSVVVMSSKLNPTGSQFSIPVLWNLCSESMEYKILRLSWGLQHWRSEFSHRSILILWTLFGKPMRERQKTLLS